MTPPLETSQMTQRAHEFALRAHAKQKRANGAPYFEHAHETAKTVKAWGMDDATVAAAYLHDVVEDTSASIELIKKEFGEEIAFLVSGVTKLGKIKYRGIEAQIENMRRMVLAMAEDIRVVLIKLADRLHNMRTLSALPAQKQRRIALETAEIYAPLAYRLGMQGLSGELRDLALPYLRQQEYAWLLENVKELYEDRVAYLERVKPIVEAALKESDITDFKIDFRAKRYSSLYTKLMRYNMDVESIYDLVAFRIILGSVNDCYATLGIIHSLWPPMPGRIKDYIAMPKPNGYRSIHTTVFCLDNRITEFQIRTRQMHEEAELGIAAHWSYKERGSRVPLLKETKELLWVRQLRQWQQDFGNDTSKFLESLKIDFFKDRIFVATPKGEVVDLPVGATPIDFAYKIHSEIGNACVGAKVSGKIVALDFVLRSGDVVEILTQRGKRPSESWLRIAKTSSAKAHIKTALKDKKMGLLKAVRPRKTVELKIAALDRIGLLKDVSAVFAKAKISILSIASPDSRAAMPMMRIKCEIERRDDLERLLVRIKKLPGVRSVEHRYM